LGKPGAEGETPVSEINRTCWCSTWVRRGTRNPVGSRVDHDPRL